MDLLLIIALTFFYLKYKGRYCLTLSHNEMLNILDKDYLNIHEPLIYKFIFVTETTFILAIYHSISLYSNDNQNQNISFSKMLPLKHD